MNGGNRLTDDSPFFIPNSYLDFQWSEVAAVVFGLAVEDCQRICGSEVLLLQLFSQVIWSQH